MPELRPYQKKDALKLAKLKCSALLNEQRTGKTPTALGIAHLQKHTKILIVCPGAALYHWKDEFEKWLQKPCIVLDGTPKQREEKLKQWTNGLAITFDTLKLVHKTNKDTDEIYETGELRNIMKQCNDTTLLIVDEFHRARNRKTLTAKALMKLSTKIPYRIALTGTPAYAKNEDIWTMLHFLYPMKFKTYWDFVNEYFNIGTKWTPNGFAKVIEDLKPDKAIKLQNFLSLVATQRKQKDPDVMPWLPAKPVPIKIKLPATISQKRHIDNLMNYFETDNVICKAPIDRLIRYRQICQDPALLDLKGTSAKTQWLEQYFKDYPNTPTIFFSNFTSYLNLIYKKCKISAGLITGLTSHEDRQKLQQAFQKGEIKYLFINIKAGKESLTLDTAEIMIFLDKFPPAGDISQASERFTATREDRKDIPKTIYELMIADSYDEQLYDAVQEDKSITDVLNNFNKYIEQRTGE